MMAGRLGAGMEMLGTRTPPQHAEAVQTRLAEKPLAAFRRFYADTATFGSRAAITCAAEMFGTDHLLFGTDMPFDPEQGPGFIRATLRAIEEMQLTKMTTNDLLAGNAQRLLNWDQPV